VLSLLRALLMVLLLLCCCYAAAAAVQGDKEGSATRPSGRRADATEPCACGPKCPARGRCRHGRRQVRPIGTVIVSRRSLAGYLNRALARPISVRYDSPCSEPTRLLLPRPAICQSAQQAGGAGTPLHLSMSLFTLLDLKAPASNTTAPPEPARAAVAAAAARDAAAAAAARSSDPQQRRKKQRWHWQRQPRQV
jgi:hypothetical protein